MNERTLFEGITMPHWNDPFRNDYRDYEDLPELNTVEELQQQEALSCKYRGYTTPADVFDKFLSNRFGYSLSEFMKLYAKTHFSTLGLNPTDEDVDMIVRLNQVPPRIICYFEESSDPSELSKNLVNYQQTITNDLWGRPPLNLHTPTVYTLTLVRAKFNLEDEDSKFYFGYHFTTDKFRFFIKSSIQFDLTIVYEEF